MSTTSSTATTYFNGSSPYAAQLNNVISQAVARATLPITQLQNQQSTLTAQQSEMQTLGQDFSTVQSAIDGLNTAASSSSYSATVDQTSIATATVGSNALAGTYSLDVTSLGSETNTISSSGVTDPSSGNISSASSFTLSVNGQSYSLTPSSNTLDSLVQSINQSGAGVQATLVNVGGSTPQYRLSIQSTQYAADSIQLNDGTNNLLTTLSTGSPVTYQVNGQPSTPISSNSRTLNVAPGLTANVLAAGSANITVAQDNSGVSTALTTFVTAYNAAVDELTKNRGQNGGALAGDTLVSQLQYALNSIGSYSGASSSSGSVNSLSAIGLSFDTQGHLELDSSQLSSVTPNALSAFLGSETGGGFIESAYNTLNGLTNSSTGTVTQAENNIGKTVTSIAAEISTKQTQLTQMQTNLTSQMSAADAALASLSSQLTQITDLFSAEQQAEKNITG